VRAKEPAQEKLHRHRVVVPGVDQESGERLALRFDCGCLHRGHAQTTGEDDEKPVHHEIEEENQNVLQAIDARQRQAVVGDA
jgi:hypothetical protein